SEILDFLFSPKLGIGFQHLKVEIGSGMNSTCGAEPSHAITLEELDNPVPRGYEFWLAAEAKKRNPDIILDALPWGTPYWTGDFTTQEAADWVIAFLDVAKKYYGLEFDYVGGCQNEQSMITHKEKEKRHPNSEKVRKFVTDYLRPTLDRRGYKDVQIVTSDFYNGHIPEKYAWSVMKDVLNYPEFADAVDVVGYHYPVGYMHRYRDDRPLPEGFIETGKRFWASEDYSNNGGEFEKGWNYVRKIIREYNELRITKSIAWAPFTSLPSGFFWNNVGFIDASEPWSGYYEIWPVLWCVAHVTQFAEPGWQFMDASQGRIEKDSPGGVYAALKSPNGKDWSLIAVTENSTTLNMEIDSELSGKMIQVWKSDNTEQFIKVESIKPVNGKIELELDGKSIYSLTTTTGQIKGQPLHVIPEEKPAGLWKDDFQSYKKYDKPKYWVDQEGTFEIIPFKGENVLKQQIPQVGCAWHRGTYGSCVSYFGGTNQVRTMHINSAVKVPDGYAEIGAAAHKDLYFRLQIHKNGIWKLLAKNNVIKEGTIDAFKAEKWQTVSFSFDSSEKEFPELKCIINDKVVFSGDSPEKHTVGVVPFIGTSYSPNMFKWVEINPVK
ncbi:MAG: hypothetical protein ABFS16_14740, partial [Bacteroidota bacterium]